MAKNKAKRETASRAAAKPKQKLKTTSRPKKTAPASRKRPRTAGQAAQPRTKTEACLALLVRPEGASIAELQQATGWQAHSVRGFLSGVVKKIPGASLTSDKPDQRRRYYPRRA